VVFVVRTLVVEDMGLSWVGVVSGAVGMGILLGVPAAELEDDAAGGTDPFAAPMSATEVEGVVAGVGIPLGPAGAAR